MNHDAKTSAARMEAPQWNSLVDVVRHWARVRPDALAYCFLERGQETGRLTFAELDERARAVAAVLQEHSAQGERAVLLFPQGLDYLCAFLGCLYANTTAVTASLPRGDRRTERVRAIMRDSSARFVLTDSGTFAEYETERAAELAEATWIRTDAQDGSRASQWRAPALGRDTLAFLQYTSGSTSVPKGVMLTHGNLLSNEAQMADGFELHDGSVFMSWLPLFHDMGLIAMALSALYNGVPCYLMSPEEFVRRPILWLEAISRYRATITAAPDFAFRLCVDRVTPEQLTGLDLGSMRTLINAAEPVRMSTLDRFVAKFQDAGLRADALYSAYGLAEASVYVCAQPIADNVRAFDRAQLEAGRGVECATQVSGQQVATLVSCGRSAPTIDIRIVDAQILREKEEARVGEIWVHSPSTSNGYWDRPDVSAQTLHARMGDDARPFLRTGDLGFMLEGRLFICGRMKELIIIRGRNIYPDDVTALVEQSAPALRSRPAAAFSIDTGEQEELIVVASAKGAGEDDAELLTAIKCKVAEELGIEPGAVLIVPNNNIARTTSGKVQHVGIRQDFIAGRLQVRTQWLSQSVTAWKAAREGAPGAETAPEPAALPTDAADPWLQRVQAQLHRLAAALASKAPEQLDAQQGVIQLGLDSLKLMSLLESIERHFRVDISLAELARSATLGGLAQLIAVKAQAPAKASVPPAHVEEWVI